MPGMEPEQIIQQRIDSAVKAATETLHSEIKYWKKIATERLLDFVKTIRPVTEDDIMIFTIPVGNMPAHQISDYIAQFSKAMENARTDGGFRPFECFWLPTRPDGTGPTMEVLSPNDDDILVIRIPVGNLPESEAQEFINEIKANFTITNKKIKDVVWIPVRGKFQITMDLRNEDK